MKYVIGPEPDWSLIPEYMRGGLKRYIENGIEPGHFLAAVLQNDLRQACERADSTNMRLLFEYVQFLYNYAPSECWGSVVNYSGWIKKGGLSP